MKRESFCHKPTQHLQILKENENLLWIKVLFTWHA